VFQHFQHPELLHVEHQQQLERAVWQPAFGQISQTDPNYVPRQYQFVLKVLF
jgi:hypothetical protein